MAVNTFAVFQNQLWVGGNFGTAGGSNSKYVAIWNGVNWITLTSPTVGNYEVYALKVYKNEMYGSTQERVMKWGGSQWSNVGGVIWNGGIGNIFLIYIFSISFIYLFF